MTASANWPDRAAQVGATPFDAGRGVAWLAERWAGARPAFDAATTVRLAAYLSFVQVGAGRRLIVRDEPGEFMAIVLDGTLAVERRGDGPDAAPARPMRPMEAGPGDVVGEVSLLDAGPRLFDCTTRTPCVLAVIEADALARLMGEDAPLALVLLAALARRLSLRLRQTSTRLSALLADD